MDSEANNTEPIRWYSGQLSKNLTSQPANPVSEAPLALLVDIDSVRPLLDDLSALVGIPTALLDMEGKILQSAGWQKACTDFHRVVSGSCANCTESDLFLARHLREGEVVDYRCKNGLWDVVTPLLVGKQHLGNLYCGQFFYDDDLVDEAFFVAQAERFGYDELDYLAAIREVPRFSRDHVRRIMAFIVGLASHLSNLSLTNLKLMESQGQMETLINTLPDPVWLKDTEGVFLSCNRAFESMLGAPAAKIIGKTDDDFCSAEQASFFRQKDREAIIAAEPQVTEEWFTPSHGGHPALLETIKIALPGLGGIPRGILGIARDITERKRAEDSHRLMSKVFSDSGEAIMITDASNRILATNREFTKLTGYSQEEAIGRNPSFLSSGETPREIFDEMWHSLAETDHWQGELWDRRKSGETYPKRLSISVVKGADGKIVNYIANFENITDRRAAEDNMRYLAHHDALTGLPNRFSLYERMDQLIAFARRFETSVAVMLIDLDGFKAINDTFGHNSGDQLLVQVAKRLQQFVRESDIVARLGGDEFVVVLSGVGNTGDVAMVAGKIVEQVSAPYTAAGNELRTSPSIGICFYPGHGADTSELLKYADIAMYHAKAAGKGNFQFYSGENVSQSHSACFGQT